MRKDVLDYHTPTPRARMQIIVSRSFVAQQLVSLMIGVCCWFFAGEYLGLLSIFLFPVPILQVWLLTMPAWSAAIKRSPLPFFWKLPIAILICAGPLIACVGCWRGLLAGFVT